MGKAPSFGPHFLHGARDATIHRHPHRRWFLGKPQLHFEFVVRVEGPCVSWRVGELGAAVCEPVSVLPNCPIMYVLYVLSLLSAVNIEWSELPLSL